MENAFNITSLNYDYNPRISAEGRKIIWVQTEKNALLPIGLTRGTQIVITGLTGIARRYNNQRFEVCERAGSTIILKPVSSTFNCSSNARWGYQTGGAVATIIDPQMVKNISYDTPSRANHYRPDHHDTREHPYAYLENKYLSQ